MLKTALLCCVHQSCYFYESAMSRIKLAVFPSLVITAAHVLQTATVLSSSEAAAAEGPRRLCSQLADVAQGIKMFSLWE